MEILERKRDNVSIIAASFTPIVIAIPIILLLPRVETFIGVAIMYLALLYFWVKNGTKPAAWVKHNTLHIRSGLFEEQKISKDLVESMRYETNHWVEIPKRGKVEGHRIIVKMRGFEEWEIPTIDHTEHINDMRLYKFISEKFWPLSEPVKVNT